jgi:hypothetical protein
MKNKPSIFSKLKSLHFKKIEIMKKILILSIVIIGITTFCHATNWGWGNNNGLGTYLYGIGNISTPAGSDICYFSPNLYKSFTISADAYSTGNGSEGFAEAKAYVHHDGQIFPVDNYAYSAGGLRVDKSNGYVGYVDYIYCSITLHSNNSLYIAWACAQIHWI